MRLRAVLAVSAAAVVGLTTVPAGGTTAPSTAQRPERTPAVAAEAAGPTGAAPVAGVPTTAPPAAHRREPALPPAAGWPFGEQFPRTAGTGRLKGGAAFWTDFVYDDRGALGLPVAAPVSSLAPTIGTYTYPEGAAHGNGADIFRAAVGAGKKASFWRVDWTTLADADVPIAVWALSLPGRTGPADVDLPGGAGLAASGADLALLVSSRAARLVRVSDGRVRASLPVVVDKPARSFVVRVPRAELKVSGRWTVRLAAGLADEAGTGFAPVTPRHGARPGQPAVYNVAFRTHRQEAAACAQCPTPDLMRVGHGAQAANANLWNEANQAATLARGQIAKFRLAVDWSDLRADRTTREPRPTGSSVRWYVTRLALGQGVVHDAGGAGNSEGDLRPNFLARIQPYAVHVPKSYRRGQPTPLTWVLHSLGVNHNQYTALNPEFLRHLCDGRGTICATTLGHGADGWYHDEAEADFWQVWRALASAYTLDTRRTIVSGYSMGGYAAYKLGLTYPEMFAHALSIAGPPACGARVFGPVGGAAGDGNCADAGDMTPLVGNAVWLPYQIAAGAADQLVPYTSVVEQVRAFDAAGLRYRFTTYPGEDHIAFAVKDGYRTEVDALPDARSVRNPGVIDFTWYPGGFDRALGVGPTGAYWVRGLQARSAEPGATAHVRAISGMRPLRAHERVVKHRVSAPGDPSPGVVREASWQVTGAAPEKSRRLVLDLDNVRSLRVDLDRAGFRPGKPVRVTITSDDATTVRLHLGERLTVLRVGAGASSATVDW